MNHFTFQAWKIWPKHHNYHQNSESFFFACFYSLVCQVVLKLYFIQMEKKKINQSQRIEGDLFDMKICDKFPLIYTFLLFFQDLYSFSNNGDEYYPSMSNIDRINLNILLQIFETFYLRVIQRFLIEFTYIKMQRSTEDFFGTVSSMIDVSDLQEDKPGDTSLTISTTSFLSITNSKYEHLGHRLLKRKPNKESSKPLKNIELDSNYTNSIKFKLINDFAENKDQCLNVDAQLDRLQKTLVSSKSSKKLLSGSRSGRLLKKMVGEKQNLLLTSEKITVTSEQLHSLQDQDEEIKQILLALARFEEQQKLQNDQLQRKIQAISSKINKSQELLLEEKLQITNLKSLLIKQTKKMRQQQYQLLKKSINDVQNY